jgi:hypothetical protein
MKNIVNWLRLAGSLGLNIYCLVGIINHHIYIPTFSARTSGIGSDSLTVIIIIFLISLIITVLAIYSFYYVPDDESPMRWKNPGVWFFFSILILAGIALILEFYNRMGIIKVP